MLVVLLIVAATNINKMSIPLHWGRVMESMMEHRTSLVEQTATKMREEDMSEFNMSFSWVDYILTATSYWGFRVDEVYIERLVSLVTL